MEDHFCGEQNNATVHAEAFHKSNTTSVRSTILRAIFSGARIGALLGAILGGITAFIIYLTMAPIKAAPGIPNEDLAAIILVVIGASMVIGMAGCAFGYAINALNRRFIASKLEILLQKDSSASNALLGPNADTNQNSRQDGYVRVPLLPMLGFSALTLSCVLELLVVIGHYFSAGRWPAPIKLWIVTVIFAICGYCRFKTRKKYRIYCILMNMIDLTAGQAISIVCVFMVWVFFMVWVAFGPPGLPLF